MRDPAAAALALCLLAFLANILIDIGWDYVAVGAPAFLALGVLLGGPGRTVTRREPVWAVGAVVLAAAVCLSFAAPYVAQRKVDQAVVSGNPARAAQAHAWNPVSLDPLLTEAALERAGGNDLKALALYRQATTTQPENPEGWVELGLFELNGLRNPCAAYRSLSRAWHLDRYDPAVALHGGPLDQARARARKLRCA